MTWTLILPYDKPPLTLNGGHGNVYAVARVKRALRATAHWLALEQQLPKGLAHVHITLTYVPATTRSRDKTNLQATMKSAVDGLALGKGKVKGYGIVADDDDTHVTEHIVIAPKGPALNAAGHRLMLTIEERP